MMQTEIRRSSFLLKIGPCLCLFIASAAQAQIPLLASRQGRSIAVKADAHSYRHCHNINTRVYCHKKERLPTNWPPLTDTPHR